MVGLGLSDDVAGNVGISGRWSLLRSFDFFGKEPVVDLVMDRLLVGNALAGGDGAGT